MPLGALHCPTCGAAVASTDAVRCPYCNTQLQTIQCASCFGMMFAGSKFCPHCGAAAVAKRPADMEKLICPRCKSAGRTPVMDSSYLADIQIDECPQCVGVWLDHPTFDHICRNAELQTAVLDALSRVAKETCEPTVQYLNCPLCAQQMARRNYARRSGVIVDMCPICGLWFDRNELRYIIEFIRTGGLAEAAQADAERAAADRERKSFERMFLGPNDLGDAENATGSGLIGQILNLLSR